MRLVADVQNLKQVVNRARRLTKAVLQLVLQQNFLRDTAAGGNTVVNLKFQVCFRDVTFRDIGANAQIQFQLPIAFRMRGGIGRVFAV